MKHGLRPVQSRDLNGPIFICLAAGASAQFTLAGADLRDPGFAVPVQAAGDHRRTRPARNRLSQAPGTDGCAKASCRKRVAGKKDRHSPWTGLRDMVNQRRRA